MLDEFDRHLDNTIKEIFDEFGISDNLTMSEKTPLKLLTKDLRIKAFEKVLDKAKEQFEVNINHDPVRNLYTLFFEDSDSVSKFKEFLQSEMYKAINEVITEEGGDPKEYYRGIVLETKEEGKMISIMF